MPVTSQCLDATSTTVAVDNMCSTSVLDELVKDHPFAFSETTGFITKLTFFTNATALETTDGPLSNPYYWSTVLYAGGSGIISGFLKTDPDVDYKDYYQGARVMVTCNSSVYDITYSSVNSSITDWRASLSNDTIIDLLSVVVFKPCPYLDYVSNFAQFSKTGLEIADKLALAYSQTMLAATAAAFEPRDAIASQQREQIQVAMVPKTSLYVLIAANLLLVAFGIVLSILALIALKGGTGEVQARLSIHALVATAFEARAGKPVKEVEEFFEEKHGEQGPRLGFVRTMDGGWTLERHGGDRGI